MNSQQKNSVEKALAQYEGLDIVDIARNVYSDKDIRAVSLGDFKLVEFIAIMNRAIKQLRAEIDRGNWQIMLYVYNDPELGSANISQQVNHIANHIKSNYTFDNVFSQVIWLVHYEIQCGFWDRSKMKIHAVEELSLQQAKVEIQALNAELNKRASQIQELTEALNGSKEELDDYRAQKAIDFRSLTANQQQSVELIKEIRELHSEATASNASVAAIAEQHKQILADARQRQSEDRKEFKEFSIAVDDLKKNFEDSLSDLRDQEKHFDKVVSNAVKKELEVLSYKERIEELLGFAADGALGHTFERRQKALSLPVRIWSIAVVCAAVFALWWVLHIFNSFPSHGSDGFSWSITLLNVVRTSPAFFLLYFVIAQYNKERNLQEEYAFKTAVAMTVTAYSDMIDDDNERTAMLVKTIQGIYAPPSLNKEASPIIFSTKHLAEATKNVSDAASSLKTAATDIVTSNKA